MRQKMKINDGTVFYSFYQVPQGVGAVIFDEDGVSDLILPGHDRTKITDYLQKLPEHNLQEQMLPELMTSLNDYFRGQKTDFDYPLNLKKYTLFESQVLQATRSIPYGEVRSYKWVAEKIGRKNAARAVGQALKKNCVPVIIPCHRVLKSDRGLGGFNAGIGWKKRLLELEKDGIFARRK